VRRQRTKKEKRTRKKLMKKGKAEKKTIDSEEESP
jgi:hypothetical protein